MLYRSLCEHTLGTGEGAVLRALGESTVEEGVEGGIHDIAEVVVHLDILLEGLATIDKA